MCDIISIYANLRGKTNINVGYLIYLLSDPKAKLMKLLENRTQFKTIA